MTPAIRDAGTLGQRRRVKAAGPARIRLLAAAVALTATNYALARRAERRNPPDGKCLQIDRVRLHYIDRGKGPPVILLHGNGTMARDFALSGLIDLLAKDHRVKSRSTGPASAIAIARALGSGPRTRKQPCCGERCPKLPFIARSLSGIHGVPSWRLRWRCAIRQRPLA